jgi:thiol-disulfide isomerase/thioredoxin
MNAKRITMWFLAVVLVALSSVTACTKEEPKAKVEVVTIEDRYPGISLGMLKNAKLTDLKSDLVAEAGGAQITVADLQSMIQELPPEYLPQLQKNLIFLLEQRVARTILLQEAKAVGVPTEGQPDEIVIQGLADHVAQTATVADEDIQKFYEANKALIGEAPLEEVKETIQAMLLQERQQAVLTAFIEQLEKRADIRVNREWFEQQSRLTRDNPVDQARLSGKPTVVQFGAASSVPSEMMTPVMEGLQQKHSQTLNVVMVNVGDEQILGARYGIRSVPTQVFFDKTGKEITRNQGVLDAEELAKEVAGIGVN